MLGLVVASLIAAAPVVFSAHQGIHYRNLRVVEEGVLYRSGQLTPAGLDRVTREKAIKTVVTFRTTRVAGRVPPDTWEEAFCAERGMKHVRIVPRLWSPDEHGEIPAEDAIREFLAVMDNKENYPVLVHCFAGIHRTGTMCAIFRMEYHRWPADGAVNEMQHCGFDPLDMQQYIEGYLRAYVPRWKRSGQ
jgi:tyrosine-protein phosphatase SIW14